MYRPTWSASTRAIWCPSNCSMAKPGRISPKRCRPALAGCRAAERECPMPVPIVCFVGKSNSGKTTFIERVIPELVRAGYKIATVKHAGHGFDLDTEGKDSWRHKQAGASSVVILSKGSMAMFADASDQLKVEDIRDRFLDGSYDLIIAEGWKHEGYPKIVIIREQVGEIPISSEGLLAVGSDKPLDLHVPRFDLDDVPAVAALIMKHFPLRRVRGEHELDV